MSAFGISHIYGKEMFASCAMDHPHFDPKYIHTQTHLHTNNQQQSLGLLELTNSSHTEYGANFRVQMPFLNLKT